MGLALRAGCSSRRNAKRWTAANCAFPNANWRPRHGRSHRAAWRAWPTGPSSGFTAALHGRVHARRPRRSVRADRHPGRLQPLPGREESFRAMPAAHAARATAPLLRHTGLPRRLRLCTGGGATRATLQIKRRRGLHATLLPAPDAGGRAPVNAASQPLCVLTQATYLSIQPCRNFFVPSLPMWPLSSNRSSLFWMKASGWPRVGTSR